jgi:hypothetical protein
MHKKSKPNSLVIDASEPLGKQIAGQLGSGVLRDISGRIFQLYLAELAEVRLRAGWFRFSLALRDSNGTLSQTPLMVGIVSGGGRGVMPWFEGRINPQVQLAGGAQLDARTAGLESALIELIGTLVPAGGHLMLEYESPGQTETHRELLLRVPPAATYLGSLMFLAGFRGHFKDWYISEGGHEGPRKLQANKSPNAAAARDAMRANLEELKGFLRRPLPTNAEDAALIARAQGRARSLVKDFGGRMPRAGC